MLYCSKASLILCCCPYLDRPSHTAGLLEIYKVYQFAIRLPRFTRILTETQGSAVGARFQRDFDKLLGHFTKFQDFAECVIDMNALPELIINPTHDPDLAELREEMDEVETEIHRLFEKAKVRTVHR